MAYPHRGGDRVIAARKYGVAEIADPRAFTSGKIRNTYETCPEIGKPDLEELIKKQLHL